MRVSIICVTYLESNQPYLDLALKSIKNLDFPKDEIEVIVVSSGEYKPFTHGFTNYHSDTRMHFPEGVNYGVSLAKGDNFLIINDDVILTRDSLANICRVGENRELVLGPISNCDNYWHYNLPFVYQKDNGYVAVDKRFYRLNEWPDHNEMMNAQSFQGPGVWFKEFICFYTVFIPRVVWNKVGTLDGEYKTGQDDLDYCKRAYRSGIACGIVSNALVWHFGGVASSQVLTDEERAFNIKKYFDKWKELPK